jgi:ribosomal protein S27E
MSLRTRCPHCEREAVLVAEALGKNVRCKGCGKPFTARPAKAGEAETRTAVKAGPATAAKMRNRPLADSDDDDHGSREESKATLWIGLSAIGAATTIASILVFVLIVNRHPQPQPQALAQAPPPPPARQAPAVEPAPVVKGAPKPVEPPPAKEEPRPKVELVAKVEPKPKAAEEPSELYGTQGGERIAPAVSGPNVLMRCRADDTFYHLDEAHVEPSGANPRGTIAVHYRKQVHGKLAATHLFVRHPNDRKEAMVLGALTPESGTIRFAKDAGNPTQYPEEFECFLARVDSSQGQPDGIYMVSDVVRVGNVGEPTMPRDWTAQEIARFGKSAPPAPATAPANLYGTQGNEPIASAVPSPLTVMRARSDDSFYRLDNPRTEASGGAPRSAFLVHFRTELHGKCVGTHLMIRYGDGRKTMVAVGNDLLVGAGTLRAIKDPTSGQVFPEDIECFLVRVDTSFGSPQGFFLVSDVVRMGTIPDRTRPRDWTAAEIARFTKESPVGLRENAFAGVGRDTPFAGSPPSPGQVPRRYLDPKGHLIGLEFGVGMWMNEPCLNALRPVYSQDQNRLHPQSVVAKEGYAVAGADVQYRNSVDAIKLHFRRVRPDGSLDPNDVYDSPWFGATDATARVMSLGNTGARVLGVFTRGGAVIDSVALVLEGP